jgi:hypothetical protein
VPSIAIHVPARGAYCDPNARGDTDEGSLKFLIVITWFSTNGRIKRSEDMLRRGKKALIVFLLLGLGAHAFPTAGLCQSVPFPTSKLPVEIRDSIASSLAALPNVLEVKKLATAQQFSRAKVHLSGSERIVEQLFGRQYPVYVRFGIALRRSLLSKGAALVADQELLKLKENTRNEGATWIKSIIAALQRSTTCSNSVWVDSLIPLLELPEGRELCKTTRFKLSRGGVMVEACRGHVRH